MAFGKDGADVMVGAMPTIVTERAWLEPEMPFESVGVTEKL